MVYLFNNCFKEEELDRNITCANFAQVQIEWRAFFARLWRETVFCMERTAGSVLPFGGTYIDDYWKPHGGKGCDGEGGGGGELDK